METNSASEFSRVPPAPWLRVESSAVGSCEGCSFSRGVEVAFAFAEELDDAYASRDSASVFEM